MQSSSTSKFIDYIRSTEMCLLAPHWEPQSAQSFNAIDICEQTVRFYRIQGLSVQPEDELLQAMENVIAGLTDPSYRWIYYLVGNTQGIELYLGVVKSKNGDDLPSHARLLRNLFVGNFAGADLNQISNQELNSKINLPLRQSQHFGIISGVPSRYVDQQGSIKPNTSQTIDRLTNSLLGEEWQLIITAEPATTDEVNQLWHQVLQLATDLQPHVKHSVQHATNQGQSVSESHNAGSSVAHTISESSSTSKSNTVNKGLTTSKNHQVTKAKSNGAQTTKSASKNTSSGGSSSSETLITGDAKVTNEGTTDSNSNTDSSGSSNGTSDATSTSDTKNISKSDTKNTGDSKTTQNNQGSSRTESTDLTNKKLSRLGKHLDETLLTRVELGRSKGFFKTAIYVAARSKSVYDQLSRGMISIFQGNQSVFTPLQSHYFTLPEGKARAAYLFGFGQHSVGDIIASQALLHSIPIKDKKMLLATWLNTSELSLIAGLPSKELPGIKLRDNVEFAVNITSSAQGVELGHLVQYGRELKNNVVRLDSDQLNKHIFISGVTGAGKTTTCQQLLISSGLPFLVIEPAKTEYRTLVNHVQDLQFYTLGDESKSPFRFNPFELLPNQKLSGHIDALKATFAAVFPMEAAMPYLIEESIVRTYQNKGWDIHDDSNYYHADPWSSQGACWPIMSEVLETMKEVIASKNFGMDLQQKYEGSLIARLDNLTVGAKGRMLNTRVSLDIDELLDQKVVIELEELRDESDKSLMMGLLIGRVAEAMKQRHKRQPLFRHLTLIEEAHRLLGKPDPTDGGAKRLGINLFANLLAEVRKYGEGLIIADQIPNKLTPEVMKNTNTKIVHRLFAADDRHAIGDTIQLDDEQKNFLSTLATGEAIVYSAGWHKAARVRIKASTNTSETPLDESLIRQQGMRRLWQARHRLYPRVAKLHDWPEQGFGDLIQQGLKCLGLWIIWGQQSAKKSRQSTRLVTGEMLEKSTQAFLAQLPAGVAVVAVLAALFEDGIPIAYPEATARQGSSINTALCLVFGLFNSNIPDLLEPISSIEWNAVDDAIRIFSKVYQA